MAAIAAQITNAGLRLIGTVAAGNDVLFPSNSGFVAVGTSNTTPTVNDTKLGAESSVAGSRKAVTVTQGTNPGEFLVSGTLQATDAVGVNVAEVGIFAGSSANTAANTGVLFARALFSHPNKLNTEVITLVFDITL